MPAAFVICQLLMMRLSALPMPLPYLLLARHLALLYVVGLLILITAKLR
jgi:hypothetical protein